MRCGGWGGERIWSYVSRAGDGAGSMGAMVSGERPRSGEGSELGRWCGGGEAVRVCKLSAKERKAETVSVIFLKTPCSGSKFD